MQFMNWRMVNLFFICLINVLLVYALTNYSPLVSTVINSYDTSLYFGTENQSKIFFLVIILIVGVSQPIFTIFISTVLTWLISILTFKRDEFKLIHYYSTLAYWLVLAFSIFKAIVVFYSNRMVNLDISNISNNPFISNILRITSLDALAYILLLSILVGKHFSKKVSLRCLFYILFNSTFYLLFSVIISTIPIFL